MSRLESPLPALRAAESLRVNSLSAKRAIEQLAKGTRVNSAADDAASLDVGRILTAQFQGIAVAVRNINDGIGLAQTAEAALTSINASLQRMRELAIQSASGTLDSGQRAHLDEEYQAHKQEILQIVQQTTWNGHRLLKELSPTTFQIQAGPDAGMIIPVTIPKVYAGGTLIGFPNGDFESSPVGSSTASGWTIINGRVKLDGTSQIGNWPTPIDPLIPAGPGESVALTSAGTFAAQVVAADRPAGGTTSLRLEATRDAAGNYMRVSGGFGVVHGPAVVSNTAIAIEAGQSVSFDWKAQGGDDDYDVYAYLLNDGTGETVELLNATGSVSNWATVTKTVPTSGDYKFVFVSGTFDATGGRALGARLFIDNIVAPPLASPSLNDTSIATVAGAADAMTEVGLNVESVLAARAALGAVLNRFIHAADSLADYSRATAESRSAVMETDYARTVGELARTRVVESAAGLMLDEAHAQSSLRIKMIQDNKGLFGTT